MENRGGLRIRCGAVWTGSDAEPKVNVDIVVEGDHIAGIVPREDAGSSVRASSVSTSGVAAGRTVIDLGDATVVPGLIDAHLHLWGLAPSVSAASMTWSLPYRALRATKDLRRLLEAGFTSVRCMGSPIGPALQRAVEEGLVEGPRIVAAGEYICQRGGTWDPIDHPGQWAESLGVLADGVDECRRRVRERIRAGSRVIKIGASSGRPFQDLVHPWADGADVARPNYSIDELKAAVEEAHRAGLKVGAHAIGEKAVRRAVLAGVDTIEHGHGASDDTYKMMADRGVVLVPTLALPAMRARFGREKGLAPRLVAVWQRHHEQQMASVSVALRAGVSIAAGTDFVGPPYTPYGENAYEFQLLVEAGLTAPQALAAGTVTAARALGMESRVGAITSGQRADLVGVWGRPWEDVTALRRVCFVMQGGRVVVQPIATT